MKKCKIRGCKNPKDNYHGGVIYCRLHQSYLKTSRGGRDINREKARIRDHHTCQKCGKVWNESLRRFDVHHLNGLCGKKSRGYDRTITGLITYCHKCHMGLHSNLRKRKGCRTSTFYKTPQGIELLNQLYQMRKQGYTFDEIAKKHNMKQVSVYNQLAKYKV